MNKIIMSIFVFFSLLMLPLQSSMKENNGLKQKVKKIVSAVAQKITATKKVVVAVSTVASIATTAAVLWKYTKVFASVAATVGVVWKYVNGWNWFLNKNSKESSVGITGNNHQITKDQVESEIKEEVKKEQVESEIKEEVKKENEEDDEEYDLINKIISFH